MSNNLPNNKLYTIGEISEVLGVSIGTLRRWERKGRLKSVRTLGGHRRYSLENIKILGAKKDLKKTSVSLPRRKELSIPPISPVSIRTTPLIPPIPVEPLYVVPPLSIPFRGILNLGLRGLIIFLVIFSISKTHLVDQAISLIPSDIKSEIAQTSEKYGVTKFLNERIAQVEQIVSTFRQSFPEPEIENQKETKSAVLAESVSRDLTLDVNIDARFRGEGINKCKT